MRPIVKKHPRLSDALKTLKQFFQAVARDDRLRITVCSNHNLCFLPSLSFPSFLHGIAEKVSQRLFFSFSPWMCFFDTERPCGGPHASSTRDPSDLSSAAPSRPTYQQIHHHTYCGNIRDAASPVTGRSRQLH